MTFQVYNEQIMDLLSASSKPLKINEDPAKGIVVVAGLAEMVRGDLQEGIYSCALILFMRAAVLGGCFWCSTGVFRAGTMKSATRDGCSRVFVLVQ